MTQSQTPLLETKIQTLYEQGEVNEAITTAVEGYGPEILGFLVSLMESRDHASEVFLQFCEDLVKGIHKFRWQSSFRTWAYAVARNAMRRFYKDPHHRVSRQIPLEDWSNITQHAERIRTRTMLHLRTEVKDQMRLLRERLDPDDQVLLILRIDKNMNWRDVARVMLDSDASVEGAQLERKASALRKRYERAKQELRQLAVKEGLLDNISPSS